MLRSLVFPSEDIFIRKLANACVQRMGNGLNEMAQMSCAELQARWTFVAIRNFNINFYSYSPPSERRRKRKGSVKTKAILF